MVLKTISALAIYLVPFGCLMLLNIDSLIISFLLWAVMGFGKAFIGMAVMHDSLHGSYSKNKAINRFVSWCTWLIGVDPTNWKIQHNVLHHTYTNMEDGDEDIEPRFVFRFSPNQPRVSIQRFQHIYAFLFYGLSTLIWITVKDFAKASKYKKEKLLKSGWPYLIHIAHIIVIKIVYLSVFLLLPALLIPHPFWMVGLMFLTMHFVAGYMLTFTFQCAHIIETAEFKDIESGIVPENRLVHQLRTTSNFGVNSKILFWFFGGLNHQIEHHLFPNICHIHYRKISKIVKATANEFDIPYHSHTSMASAIYHHLKMLKALGTGRI